MQYYNPKIQIHRDVIVDVFSNFTPNSKMLVFGLGYDSKMWYEGNNKNTFFVENNDDYIKLNKRHIPEDKIIKYDYKTKVNSSFTMNDSLINTFEIPEKIMNEGPYDIIIIDGPEGHSPNTPGRLIPCYWATLLSKPGTIIYIDDSKRPLESYSIRKYFNNYDKQVFNKRLFCTKIYIR